MLWRLELKAERELDVVLAKKKNSEDSIGLLKKSATQDYAQ